MFADAVSIDYDQYSKTSLGQLAKLAIQWKYTQFKIVLSFWSAIVEYVVI